MNLKLEEKPAVGKEQSPYRRHRAKHPESSGFERGFFVVVTFLDKILF